MRTYRKWVMTLGIIAVTPGLTMAGPLSFLKNKPDESTNGAPGAASHTGRRSNQQVAENVARVLREAGLTGYEIEIEFKSGVAILSGKVGTADQRRLATELIGKIPEVKKVENRLTPIHSIPQQNQQVAFETEERAATPQIQHAAIGQDLPSISAAPQSPAAPAQPVANPVNPAAAESAAENAGQSNQQVAEQIAAALSSASLNGYNIEIRYQDGTATLAGAVANLQQRETAGQVVSRIPGVQSVRNHLTCPGADPAAQQAFASRQQLAMAAYQPGGGAPDPAMPQGGAPGPYGYGGPMGAQPVLNNPSLPPYAWPSYASYPNYGQVTYPTQYSASAWPYIGPFYPYPQVPLGWRQVQLEWDDGMWNLNFRPRTDRWWWFMNPKNW